jgi:cellulose synthase/poly-beta-1,6-N-acetylglucosamine synthase-like glycosyltransferase
MTRAIGLVRVGVVAFKAYVAALSCYLALLTAAAWVARAKGRHRTVVSIDPQTRFAVLVPAHDEERLIAATLSHLTALDYPTDRYEIHLVADNCTDRTAAIGRDTGVHVHERSSSEDPGKGPALRWLLSELAASGSQHTAVLVVDADTLVDRRALRVFDAYLSGGSRAVQGFYGVRDAESGGANVALRAVALSLRHYVRPLGRTTIGASSGLYGNGMAFDAALVDSRTWSNHLTEDIEFQMELLLDDIPVAFAPDAIVQAEMPVTLADARSQHERWERGRIELARRYVPRLVRRASEPAARNRIALIDGAVDHIVPPLSVLVMAAIASTALSCVDAIVRPSRRRVRRVGRALLPPAVIAAHVMTGLVMIGAPPALYKSLLGAPRLIWWKVRLWLGMHRPAGDVRWTRTTRNADVADVSSN